jgi:[ribosomal protein S18]-alanine N-acetyltransferase
MAARDLEAVVELDRISFTSPWSMGSYRHELLENPHAHLWVAERENQIIGVLAAWLILDEFHIGTVAIHPDHMQHGIGKALVETALREGIARGAKLSHLEVRRSNLPAQNLYLSLGFEIVGERKKYYPDNREDALLMSVHGLGENYINWLDRGRQGPFVPKP